MHTISKNRIDQVEWIGIQLMSADSRVEKNGIRNKAKKCETDVSDDFPADNTYEKNSFPPPT